MIDKARIEINEVDKDIINCLEKRFKLAKQIGEYKRKNNLEIFDEKREQQVINNCLSYLENEKYSNYIIDIYKQIMSSCKELQNE